MSGRAREVKIFELLVAIFRTKVADLPEVVTEPEGSSLFKVESLPPDFGLVYDFEFDVLS